MAINQYGASCFRGKINVTTHLSRTGTESSTREKESSKLAERFLTVELKLRILANLWMPNQLRKQPETFCFVLSGRRSRSAKLFGELRKFCVKVNKKASLWTRILV